MAETVNYSASTSKEDSHPLEPSVEIVVPKPRKNSVTFNEDLPHINDIKSEESDHPNRPSGSLWKQQRLPAWQPILTADTVLPAFFLLAIALIPIGVGLLISSEYVKEYTYDYTDCLAEDGKTKCSDVIKSLDKNVKCACWHQFEIDQFKAPVFLYYGLQKFYQNHRRYVQSRDDDQLLGKDVESLAKLCKPYREDKNGRSIAPCGAIANSLFTDTYKLYLINDNQKEPIDLIETDIAWPTDKEFKFDNPQNDGAFAKYSPPPYWHKHVDDLDPNHPNNNGFKNEHLIVWMRTAALPSFRKLWARIDHDQNILWRTSLPKGKYSIRINYTYPVIYGDWNGRKLLYLSNTSWLGGKNNFLGIAYIVVGSICLLLWIAFLIIVKKMGKKPKDIVDIGPKTTYIFPNYKSIDSSDEVTQPLRTANIANQS